MFTYNLNPVLFNLGSFEIRWYGLMYIIAFVLAYFILIHLANKKYIKINKLQIEDLLVYSGIAGLIGARIFYILFYNLDFYVQNPLEIFAVWHGGLSFHGSVIGAITGVYIFAKKFRFNFLQLLDLTSIPFALGLGLGRVGNFINGELYGRFSNVPWCVDFGDGCRHPSQIYESLKNFIIFGTLWLLKDKKLKNGILFTIFLIMYSVLRFFIEFVRQPDSQIGFILGLTMGQWLNLAMFAAGIFLFIKINKNIKSK